MTWWDKPHPDPSPAWFLSLVVFSGDKFSSYVIFRPYSDFPGYWKSGQEYALCVICCLGILISKPVHSFSGSVSVWLLHHIAHLCLFSSHVFPVYWKLGLGTWVITKDVYSNIHLGCSGVFHLALWKEAHARQCHHDWRPLCMTPLTSGLRPHTRLWWSEQ